MEKCPCLDWANSYGGKNFALLFEGVNLVDVAETFDNVVKVEIVFGLKLFDDHVGHDLVQGPHFFATLAPRL